LNEKTGAPDKAAVHYHLGLAYEKTNQLSRARQHLEKAVKMNPENTDARKALSQLRGKKFGWSFNSERADSRKWERHGKHPLPWKSGPLGPRKRGKSAGASAPVD